MDEWATSLFPFRFLLSIFTIGCPHHSLEFSANPQPVYGRTTQPFVNIVGMAPLNPVLIDVPMPIRTPRLLIRPKQVGDGAITAAAVAETWEELHQWMRWAESRHQFTAELMEIRNRHVMASFILREVIELIGIESSTGTAVVWCGLHDIDWQGRQCDTGFWVRKSAQRRGFATEAANAMVRYAFGRWQCGALV